MNYPLYNKKIILFYILLEKNWIIINIDLLFIIIKNNNIIIIDLLFIIINIKYLFINYNNKKNHKNYWFIVYNHKTNNIIVINIDYIS